MNSKKYVDRWVKGWPADLAAPGWTPLEAGIFLIVNKDQLNHPSDLTEIPLKSQVINLTIL